MAGGAPQVRQLAGGRLPSAATPGLLPDPMDGGTFSCGGRAAPAGPAVTRCDPAPPPAVRCDTAPIRCEPQAVRYDTVTVPVRHGLEAVDILRLRRACGAVLQIAGGAAIAFLVPAGTAVSWHLPGSSCTAGAELFPPTDPRWVMPPTGPHSYARPTDAWVLRSALCEAARTLTAGGLGPL